MKSLKYILVLTLFSVPLQAGQHTLFGDQVVNAVNGVYTGIKGALTTATGTNVAFNFTVPTTVWTPGAGAAIRFTLTSKPTAATNGGNCLIQINGAIGTQITNVVDNINWRGSWGVLNAATNYIEIWWDGVILSAQQTPTHGVIAPAQITATQNDYSPAGLDIADEMRISSDAARTITGMAGRPGGLPLLIENIGSFGITLAEQDTGSVATNRFRNGAAITIGSHQTALAVYSVESTRWKITGNWTASAGATASILLGADQAVTSSTTFVDAANMGIAVAANTKYVFTYHLLINQAGTAAGQKVNINGPAIGAGFIVYDVNMQTSATATSAIGVPATAYVSSFASAIGVTGTHWVNIWGSLSNGVNAGTLIPQFAQSTSDANATTLKAGSYCIYSVAP